MTNQLTLRTMMIKQIKDVHKYFCSALTPLGLLFIYPIVMAFVCVLSLIWTIRNCVFSLVCGIAVALAGFFVKKMDLKWHEGFVIGWSMFDD